MYKIGQLRRSEIPLESYSTAIGYTTGTYTTIVQGNNFIDNYITLSENVSSSNNYYLQFKIEQNPSSKMEFFIKLKNNDSSKTQIIKHIIVEQGNKESIFELSFTPNSSYNLIQFEMVRTTIDYSNPREATLTVLNIDKILDVVSGYLTTKYPDLTNIKKIGIRGRSGMMFVLDGEEIYIGRSGIYEFGHNEITIKSISFVLKDNDSFIMDFNY